MDQGDRQPSITDRLAADRTRLANERTLLAYVRTALGLLVVGGSLLKFFDGSLTNALGGAFLLAGAATACLGFYRAMRTQRAINRVMRTGNSGGAAGQPPR
jgi:putative membrane protein